MKVYLVTYNYSKITDNKGVHEYCMVSSQTGQSDVQQLEIKGGKLTIAFESKSWRREISSLPLSFFCINKDRVEEAIKNIMESDLFHLYKIYCVEIEDVGYQRCNMYEIDKRKTKKLIEQCE